MTTLLFLGSILVTNMIATALVLWLVCGWMKATKATFLRAGATTLAVFSVAILALIVGLCLPETPHAHPVQVALLAVAFLFLQIAVFILIIRWIMGTSVSGAILAWLASCVPGAALLAFVIVVVKPHVLEAFVVSSNSMAPTLFGWHRKGTCPHCGQTMIVPARSPEEHMLMPDLPDPRPGICTACLKTGLPQNLSDTISAPDRFMVAKWLTPERWDLIVFRYPREPSNRYVHRLVGLPGEEVFVKEGAVWVNGVKLVPPKPLTNLQYMTEFAEGLTVFRGTEDMPLRLGQDEFCVLGDFSANSSDSRDWGPLPRDNIESVVTVRYWPFNRWKIWR